MRGFRVPCSPTQGLVIVPAMVKVGLVAGVRHGKGIAVIRDDNGAWQLPIFVSMTGGSVGWQVGIQSTDVILVFNTRRSVTGLLSGKFTVGVDAAAAAGPIGRQASAATDVRLQAEILSYSRSRGLFAGASVDGSMLQIDAAANQQYYNTAGLRVDGTAATPNAQLPPSATRLLGTLSAYAPATNQLGAYAPTNVPGTPAAISPNSPATTTPGVPADAVQDGLTATRLELVQAAQDMGALLDESWRNYLSLPARHLCGPRCPDRGKPRAGSKDSKRSPRTVAIRCCSTARNFSNSTASCRRTPSRFDNPRNPLVRRRRPTPDYRCASASGRTARCRWVKFRYHVR